MRLKLSGSGAKVHSEFCCAVAWTGRNELLSASDDQTLHKWDMRGEPAGRLVSLEAFPSDLAVFPGRDGDLLAAGCTDGTFKLLQKSGRVEKNVDAHRGAVLALKWNFEGTALASGGEDGELKVWSRAGMLRSALARRAAPVYAVAWAPDNDALAYASGPSLVVKPLQSNAAAGSKPAEWRAHEGVVLKLDWNPVTGLLASGGEDCRYKVWDAFGRLLFQSAPLEHAVTSVAWAPSGELLAVGSFETMHLCDRTGWAYSKAKPRGSGGLLSLAWSPDSTMVAGAGGSGAVVFAQLVDVELESGRLSARLDDANRVAVHDALAGTSEELLDFRDRVIKMSLGFDHLVVVTASQCLVYAAPDWHSPDRFDLGSPATLVVQSRGLFLLADAASLRVYTYEGRQLSTPKHPGLQTGFLNRASASLADDSLAIIDRSDGRTVRLFDTASGRPLGEPVAHHQELTAVALSQSGGLPERRLLLLDRNRDLFIRAVSSSSAAAAAGAVKLGSMVDSAVWHDASDMLAAMVDGRLAVWYYPEVVYTDRDLLPVTRTSRELPEAGKMASLEGFCGGWAAVRRSDGARLACAVAPQPILLHRHVSAGEWAKATRLCRHVKDPALWACLAAMAVNAGELNTAEVAYSALEEVDKLQYVLHIKEIPTEEGRAAQLALFKRQPQLAERILLQAGLVYRAIDMALTLFQWDHALELAVAHKTHVDTVLFHRARYLAASGQQERNKRFLQYMDQVEVDEASVRAKIRHELETEAARPGARRYA
uniref:Intraflagellar transport protein 80-like n=1 Tax=Tetraselmis sp. GSL018 TaxID=582737 RepID=A0A061RJ59_9CHLO